MYKVGISLPDLSCPRGRCISESLRVEMFLVQPPVGWGWEPAEQEPLGRPAGCLGLGTGGIAPLGQPSGVGRQLGC